MTPSVWTVTKRPWKNVVGHGCTWCFNVGKAHVNVSRDVGAYGHERTVSFGVRAWWS